MCQLYYRVRECESGDEYVIGVDYDANNTDVFNAQAPCSGFRYIKKGTTITAVGNSFTLACATVISLLSNCGPPNDPGCAYVDEYYYDDNGIPAAQLNLVPAICSNITGVFLEPVNNKKSCRTKIHEKFASSALDVFNANRYGLKSCKIKHDPYFLYDLLELEKVTSEIEACGKVLSCDCDCDKICERINTL